MESNINLANDEKLADEALARVKGQLAALLPEQLLQVNLDIQSATSTVLGTLPELRLLRARIAKELPAFDLVAFDNLEDYVLALSSAQASFQTATTPPDELEPLAVEASRLRELLVQEARVLSLHGLVDARKLENLKGANGKMNVAQDVQTLVKALQESWPQVQGKTPTTAEDLLAASRVATRLTRVVGVRDQGPAIVAAATDLRQRAFTLVLRTYEEARAAVSYLRRREVDGGSIAPSLYLNKGRRKVAEPDPTPAQPPAGTSPATAGSTNATPSAVTPAQGGVAAVKKGDNASAHPFLDEQPS